jgi:ectoine hydroxylase-related dioxygenase (phytanoyl-CoA dioxygenase family)
MENVMDELERFLFDVNGYLIIENALDEALLADLNAAIDHNEVRLVQESYTLSRGAARLAGERRSEFDNALGWQKPWSEPFRTLLTLPLAMSFMLELIGDGFRYDSMKGTVMVRGTEGFSLHGGAGDPDSLSYYRIVGDKMRNGLMNISYALTDVASGDGGFMCIPGSHKSTFSCPRELRRLECGAGFIREVPVPAGSAILFTEALIHGTLPWTAPYPRRTVFVRYSPGAMAFRDDPMPMGYESFADELTPLQRAVLEPPHHRDRPSIAELLRAESVANPNSAESAKQA